MTMFPVPDVPVQFRGDVIYSWALHRTPKPDQINSFPEWILPGIEHGTSVPSAHTANCRVTEVVEM